MEDFNVSILVDAKMEYTRQLISILKPHLYEGIKSIYDESKKGCIESNNKDILMVFQDFLSDIPKWSQLIIDKETNRIVQRSKCDWLDDLLTAIFVSHTKILTSIRLTKKQKKIDLIIPKMENFIHSTYIELAREFWKCPYLYSDEVNDWEYQKNMRDCEEIISRGNYRKY